MRLPRVALCIVAIIFAAAQAPSQSTPAGQSLCDSPSARGTAAYNYYCGACYPRCGNGGNADIDYAAVQRAQADAERKKRADAADQQGLEAEQTGDLDEAAKRLIEALDLEPDDPAIKAALEEVRAKLAAKIVDQESAGETEELRKRIEDSINAAHFRAARMEMEEKLARHQARAAAVDPVSADCIFDGSPGCTDPVPLVVVSAGMPPVPADAARFIASIPEKVRDSPEGKRDIDYFAHTARIRGTLQNQMIADKAAARANPGDKATLRLVGDAGSLKAAMRDEMAAKKPLLDFGAETIDLGAAPGSGNAPK